MSLLRGDLDWITLKALERERANRYGTPSELAADINRYLRHEPVAARPASAGYRLQKYVQKHRIGVGVAAVLVLLAGFAGMQAVQVRRITRERNRADRITEFMAGIFKVSDPSERVGSTVTAREVLDRASNDIEKGLAKDPGLKARMMHVMGKAYRNLGLYTRAQGLFERSISLGSSAVGQENRETLKTMQDLGWALFEQGRLPEAESLERKLLDVQRCMLGLQDPDTLGTMGNLATTLCEEGNCAQAEKLNREALEKQRHLIGREAVDTVVPENSVRLQNVQATLSHCYMNEFWKRMLRKAPGFLGRTAYTITAEDTGPL